MKEGALALFKEKVKTEKCGGEITEVKLSKFIINYNRMRNTQYSIFLEPTKSIVINKITAKAEATFEEPTKIDNMLVAMAYVMLNSNFTSYFTIRTN